MSNSVSFGKGRRETAPSRPEFRHDGYFKLNMQDIDLARGFLLWCVPELKDSVVNIDVLRRVSESFTDEDRKQSSADLLYQVPLKGKDAEGEFSELDFCIFFLIEHKSQSERQTGFQIVRYVTRIWEDWISNNGKRSKTGDPLLPFVVPIIFYHGKHKYSGPANIRDSIRSVPGLEKYLPDWSFCLIDVGQVQDDQLPDDWKLCSLIMITRGIFHDNLWDTFCAIHKMAYPHLREPGAKRFLRLLFNYASTSAVSADAKVFEEVKRMEGFEDLDYDMLPWWKKEQDAFNVAIAEKRAEGHAEGRAKGRAEGRAEGVVEGKVSQLLSVLTKRFGELSGDTAAVVKSINDISEIDRLFDLSLDVPSLDEFMKQVR